MVTLLEEISQLNNEPSACLIFLHGVGKLFDFIIYYLLFVRNYDANML